MKSLSKPNQASNIILDDVVAFLQKVPPFQFLDEANIQAVARNISLEFYPKNMVILKQDGPPSDALRIIKKGGVKIVACENTMKAQKLVYADMLPTIGYVPAGVVELMKKQQQGYAYIRP